MPHEIAVLTGGSPETSNQHKVESLVAPIIEIDTIMADNPAQLRQSPIDSETFTAVPEHGGSIKEALQQFKDNPDAPLPPCLGRLGFTSTTQVVERMEGTDDPTKRAPTVGELKAARKRASEKQAVTTPPKPAEKPKPSKETDATPASNVAHTTDKKSEARIDSDETIENTLAKQHIARIVSKVMDLPPKKNVESDVIPEATSIKPTEKKSQALVVRNEDVLELKTPVVDATVDTMTPRRTVVEKPSKIEDITHSKKQDDPVSELIAEEFTSEISEDTLSYTGTDQSRNNPSMDLEATIAENSTFDIDEIMVGRDIEYSVADDELEQIALLPVAHTDIEAEDFEFDIDTFTDEMSLVLIPDETFNYKKPVTELDSAITVDIEEPHNSQLELRTYIETLEPNKAEGAKTILKSLVEALETVYTNKDSGGETSAIEMEEIEYLFIELLDALDLNDTDETVKKLIRELSNQELLAKITQDYTLSIDQLNYLGTHEYKPTSFASLYTAIIQMIKQKIEPHLRLGKYALSASVAYGQ